VVVVLLQSLLKIYNYCFYINLGNPEAKVFGFFISNNKKTCSVGAKPL